MSSRPTAGITRLKDRYWNENAVSLTNPGGFDESADGLTAGHVVNYPNSLVDVGDATAYVGDVADQIAATQSTIVMTWDAGTSIVDPGAGKVRATTAALTAGSYSLVISTTDGLGVAIAGLLAAMGASTSSVKAKGRLVKVGDPTVYLDLSVTGVSGAGTYRTVGVTFRAGTGGFAAGDAVAFGWTETGNDGIGIQGPSGNNKVCEGGVVGGTANAPTVTASPAFTGGRGEMLVFQTGSSASSSAVTITANGVPQPALMNGAAFSGTNRLPANTRVAFVSDGTSLHMVSGGGGSVTRARMHAYKFAM